ncbi:DUF2497 domain-containing protein [Hyphococcus sp.]|uniref:DUF2497 domain-containing protein n=1 Tax=Hyphococcus sp. TaxID=2038636 RepID=UPI003CCC3AE3
MENAQPEPSMEEILASIRKIISEDEEDQSAPEAVPPAASPKPAPAPVEMQNEEPLEEPKDHTEEPMPLTSPKPVEAMEPAPETASARDDSMKHELAAAMQDEGEEEILDKTTAEVASQAFRNLSQSVRVSEGPGKTLEDIVTEMLRPMVKEWLDANLPAIVEEKVEEEVQRVARRRR